MLSASLSSGIAEAARGARGKRQGTVVTTSVDTPDRRKQDGSGQHDINLLIRVEYFVEDVQDRLTVPWATHLLEAGTDISTAQHLLEHRDVSRTMISTTWCYDLRQTPTSSCLTPSNLRGNITWPVAWRNVSQVSPSSTSACRIRASRSATSGPPGPKIGG